MWHNMRIGLGWYFSFMKCLHFSPVLIMIIKKKILKHMSVCNVRIVLLRKMRCFTMKAFPFPTYRKNH